MPEVRIGDRIIGEGHPCFIIAEAGVNHNGDMNLAHQLIDVAVNAGADAIKFQTFSADRMVTRCAPKAAYQQYSTDATESQHSMLKRLELSPAMHYELRDYAHRVGILFLSTPFDEESAELLVELRVPALKISSGDLTNLPFLDRLARKGLPMIVSTGMATMSEVAEAVETMEAASNSQYALLHCVSSYPTLIEDTNLRAMHTLAAAFGKPVGYSDHTPGIAISIAAAALGAAIIEKHFTQDRSLPGPDHSSSLEPRELKELVEGIRAVEVALGDGIKRPRPAEIEVARVARKSLVAATDISKDAFLTVEMVAIKRPANGLPPKYRAFVIGRRVRRVLAEGEPITEDVLE